MKTLLSLLGAITITSSSVGLVSSNVLVEQKLEVKSESFTNDLDWEMVKETTNNYFDDLQENQLINSNYSQDKTAEIFKYAKEQSLILIEEFSSQNLTVDEIINAVSEKFPEFKENYERSKVETQNTFYLFSENTNNTIKAAILANPNYSKELEKAAADLDDYNQVFITVTAAATIAAAVFWGGAVWSLGGTIPWALACTSIAATSGLISTLISTVLAHYRQQATELTDSALALDFLNWVAGMLFGSLVAANASLLVNLWAFALGSALIPLIANMLRDLDAYR